jgi:photosystem II stability/assembly factor-like uncharacterized protein
LLRHAIKIPMKTTEPFSLSSLCIFAAIAALNALAAPISRASADQAIADDPAAGWTRQSPLPTGANLTGVSWASATHGLMSGEGHTLLETFDTGATWRNIRLPGYPTDPFYNVLCRDATNYFVIGNSATTGRDIFRTPNAGTTWQRVSQFPLGGSWYHIDFVSPTVGFMGSNGATVQTTDGGITWVVKSDYLTCPVMYGMDFRDEQVGLCGGNKVIGSDSGPGIFKTTDAGVTWVKKFGESANDVLWLDNTTAIAIVGISIYRSTDEGETWSDVSDQVFTGFDEMTLLPNGHVVGVSYAGDGWLSTDGGTNWTRTLVGQGALPASWNVSFYDDQLGTIVGQGGYIFQTTDGGLSWKMANSGLGGVEYHDLEMFDDTTGIAVGDSGYYLRTTNGGAHWDVSRLQVTGVVLFRDETLQAVDVVDQDFVVAAGNDGVVYKSLDRGVTWQSIGYPKLSGDIDFMDIKFINRQIGYVVGSNPDDPQNMYKTTDGGRTWSLVNLNEGQSLDFVDANHGWVVNVGGLGYRTTNGGMTWQQMILPNQGFGPTISKIDFADQSVGWAVGWFGYAARTADGGRTWQLQNIATQSDQILGLHVLSRTEAYAVGAPSGGRASLYHTTDAGATWIKSGLPAQYSLSTVFATAAHNVWTAGYAGLVLHQSGTATP